MNQALLVGLLCWPLGAQEAFLIPSTFKASAGERIAVRLELAGAAVADAGIYTSRATYNLVNLRTDGTSILLDGSLKVAGTAILAITTKPRIVHRERFLLYAKALVDVDLADANATRSVGLPLELVLSGHTLTLLAAGHSLPGTVVKPSGTTDADGKVHVDATTGIHKISATRKMRCTDPAIADWDVITTTLTFEIR